MQGEITMIEYVCKECDFCELQLEIITKKKCPKCNLYLDAIEIEDETNVVGG